MGQQGETFYYWVEADTDKSLGRSNSREYALQMAERYCKDSYRFPACNMKVVADYGQESEELIAEFAKQV